MIDIIVVLVCEYIEPKHPSVDSYYIADEMTETQITDAAKEPVRGYAMRYGVRCESIFHAIELVRCECHGSEKDAILPDDVIITSISAEHIDTSDVETTQAIGYSEWLVAHGVHNTSSRIYF